MRRFLLVLLAGVLFVFPSFASAQSNVTLSNVAVQLWPEYDQPSMLVIIDFQVSSTTSLPVDLPFRIPQDANLIAVAIQDSAGLSNTPFDGPTPDGGEQVFSIPVETNAVYRFEYYQPLTFNGDERIFSYLWDGAYAVNAFSVSVVQPLDVTSLLSDPILSIEQSDGLTYHFSDPARLAVGEQFTLNLQYEKTTDTLLSPLQGIQPSAPIDENTPGRISLNNSLPYILGGVGVVLILGGFVYYWKAGRSNSKRPRRRSHSSEDANAESEAYCPQCGTRAKRGDRFCRTCGARLRHGES